MAYAQQASIEGIAVNASSGQPLAGVHVRLMSGFFDGVKDVYGAISDKAGHFSISALVPGTYFLMPEFAGFVYAPPKPEESPFPALQIKAGQKLEGYKLQLTPDAIIAGRVVDEYGDPAANVLVEVLPASYNDRTINMFGSRNVNTSDRGEFRIATAPGKYHLKATLFGGSNEPAEIRTDGTSEALYGPTYYPNSATAERATVVETAAGNEVSGLEIRLARQHGATISGTVTGTPDGSARATVMMRFGESAVAQQGSRGSGVGPDGRFSFPRLAPGFYRLYAIYSSGRTRLQSGTVDIHLEGADETNVVLALNAGGELTGTLELEGLPADKRTVRLESPETLELHGSERTFGRGGRRRLLQDRQCAGGEIQGAGGTATGKRLSQGHATRRRRGGRRVDRSFQRRAWFPPENCGERKAPRNSPAGWWIKTAKWSRMLSSLCVW